MQCTWEDYYSVAYVFDIQSMIVSSCATWTEALMAGKDLMDALGQALCVSKCTLLHLAYHLMPL